MSRFVTPRNPGLAAATPQAPDDFTARLAKYLPAEMLALYTSVVAGVAAAKPPPETARWIAIVLVAVFLAGAIIHIMRKAPATVRSAHLLVAPFAFLALAYPIAAPLIGDWFLGYVAIAFQGCTALLAWLVSP